MQCSWPNRPGAEAAWTHRASGWLLGQERARGITIIGDINKQLGNAYETKTVNNGAVADMIGTLPENIEHGHSR